MPPRYPLLEEDATAEEELEAWRRAQPAAEPVMRCPAGTSLQQKQNTIENVVSTIVVYRCTCFLCSGPVLIIHTHILVFFGMHLIYGWLMNPRELVEGTPSVPVRWFSSLRTVPCKCLDQPRHHSCSCFFTEASAASRARIP